MKHLEMNHLLDSLFLLTINSMQMTDLKYNVFISARDGVQQINIVRVLIKIIYNVLLNNQ
jgi:hypothetical protein